MEIAVLVKPIPEAESRLRASADGRRLDAEGVKFVLAGYDESAVEQALLLKEAVPGSSVHVLSFGPARCEEALRSAIALGADRATWIEAPPEGNDDPLLAARALAAALRDVPHELVLAGKQAGDDEESLVPSALAEGLGIPHFGFVVDLRPAEDGRSVTFHRVTEAGVERWESPLPLLIALQQAWNDPRTAKLPNILKSRKAPIAKVPWSTTSAALATGAPSSVSERFELPAPRSGAKMIEYRTPEEAAQKLVQLLREEAKVFP